MTDAGPPPGWEDILDDDEHILWQGRPDGGLRLSGGIALSAFGAVFTAFSLFWILQARWISGGIGPLGLIFPLFGLPFLAAGLYMLVGRFFWDAYVRRATFYTLTDRRAYVATRILGRRSLAAHEIRPDTPLELTEGPPDSVHFAQDRAQTARGRIHRKIGFDYIDDGRAVYDLLRHIRKSAA